MVAKNGLNSMLRQAEDLHAQGVNQHTVLSGDIRADDRHICQPLAVPINGNPHDFPDDGVQCLGL